MKDYLQIIKNHTPDIIGKTRMFYGAVIIPLIETNDGYDVLFEVRSSKIEAQPGDICLPGGAMEGEETAPETAIRETCEELLIKPEQIEIVGPSDIFREDRMTIRPFAALLKDYIGTFSTGEVEKVFRVPLNFFLNTEPEEYIIPYKPQFSDDFPFDRIVGGRDYKWRKVEQSALFYQYEEYTIWGFTARIMKGFADIIRRVD